jgi:hypothetical protein
MSALKKMFNEYREYLKSCTSQFERTNVEAIAGREIRQKAELIAMSRPLTNEEISIATTFGYHIRKQK